MLRYNPDTHTPEALADQLATIHAVSSDALLIGSLGRAILYAQASNNPLLEFEQRREAPIGHGIKARDIDLLIDVPDRGLPAHPFLVDTACFHNPSVEITQDRGEEWILKSETRNFCEPLHPAVLNPIRGRGIFGVQGQTVPAQTHLGLFYLRGGPLRRKDAIPITVLKKMMTSNDSPVPLEFYTPFRKLAAIKMARTEAMARQIYQCWIPPRIETRIDWLLTR